MNKVKVNLEMLSEEQNKLVTFIKGFDGTIDEFNRKYKIDINTIAILERKEDNSSTHVLEVNIRSRETMRIESMKRDIEDSKSERREEEKRS